MRGSTAIFTLAALGLASMPEPAAAQSSAIVIGGQPNPETCVTRKSYFTRKRYGNTIQTLEHYRMTNRCKAPVVHYACPQRPNSNDCAKAGNFARQPLRKGQSYDPHVVGGLVMVMYACKSDEILIDWPNGVRCGVPGSEPVADTGYRGVGTRPNPNAPRATLTNAQGVMDGLVFPERLRGKRISTTATVAVAVGPNGRATGCTIGNSSGYPELDSLTCDLFMRRARFKPAVDGAGTPVEGYYVSGRVSWTGD